MGRDYTPTDIKIRMNSQSALVTMNSKFDLDDYMNRYTSFSTYSYSNFICSYYKLKGERTSTTPFDPYNMFKHFGDLRIHNPNKKPVIIKKEAEENTNDDKDDLASIIYEIVEKRDSK
jgi:hypothetical protein